MQGLVVGYKWYVPSEARAKIAESGVEPTIYFFAETVELKAGDEVVSWKSTTFMYATPDGESWKRQIEKELAAKGQPTIP